VLNIYLTCNVHIHILFFFVHGFSHNTESYADVLIIFPWVLHSQRFMPFISMWEPPTT
jgi:hypothetical protein